MEFLDIIRLNEKELSTYKVLVKNILIHYNLETSKPKWVKSEKHTISGLTILHKLTPYEI